MQSKTTSLASHGSAGRVGNQASRKQSREPQILTDRFQQGLTHRRAHEAQNGGRIQGSRVAFPRIDRIPRFSSARPRMDKTQDVARNAYNPGAHTGACERPMPEHEGI